MANGTLSVKHVAELLGVPAKTVQGVLKKDGYTPLEVHNLREQLGLKPEPLPPRRQLFLNFKGGTGKTSLSTSYAYRLAMMGYRVLIVDLDSQGHSTKCLGFEGEDFQKTLQDVLVRKTALSDVIQKSPLPNLDFVPSNLSMSTVDLSLMPLAGREFKLKNALKDIEGRYDFTIFDAPPSFGLLNLNALMAADDLFVPVLADFLSFHGLKLLFETVQSLEEDLAHVLDHVFIVVNGYNATFKLAKEAVEALREHYPEYLLPTIVRQCTKFAQASSEGVPVFIADPDCKGAHDIQALIREVLARLRERRAQDAQAQPAAAQAPAARAPVAAPPAPHVAAAAPVGPAAVAPTAATGVPVPMPAARPAAPQGQAPAPVPGAPVASGAGPAFRAASPSAAVPATHAPHQAPTLAARPAAPASMPAPVAAPAVVGSPAPAVVGSPAPAVVGSPAPVMPTAAVSAPVPPHQRAIVPPPPPGVGSQPVANPAPVVAQQAGAQPSVGTQQPVTSASPAVVPVRAAG